MMFSRIRSVHEGPAAPSQLPTPLLPNLFNLCCQAMDVFTDKARHQDKVTLLRSVTSAHQAPLLYYAVASKRTTLVKFLLDQGADFWLNADIVPAAKDDESYPLSVNSSSRSSFDSTALKELSATQIPVLALAIAQGDHDMVHLLLKRGAKPLAIPSELWLPVMVEALYHGLPEADVLEEERMTRWCTAREMCSCCSRR